jgi:hypothetical protein
MGGSTLTSIRIAFLVLAVSGGATASAQETPVRADTVNLRFDWKAGTRARIETTRLQQTSESADTVSGSASYRMRVQAHADGLIISYESFEFPTAADTTEAAQLDMLAEQAAAMVPKVVVDAAGSFVGIEDVASVRARLDTLMTRMLAPEDAASARAMLATVVTEEGLAGLAAQEWNALVGRWAGSDLAIGAEYEFVEDAALPMLQGAVVPMVSTFTAGRRTSCSDTGTGNDCVEIRVVSRADPAAVAEILTQFAAGLLAMPGVGLAFESFELENTMVLVTEPSTLRPHRVRLSKGMKGVFTADGERSEVSQTEVRTYRYTYAR